MPSPGCKIPNDPNVAPEDIEPDADLEGADLSEATLRDSDLSGANLWEANLSRADLAATDLSEADLEDVDLSDAKLRDANLSGANLFRADLSRANLFDADLARANLFHADFSDDVLTRADLTDSVLWNTSLSGALLSRQTDFEPPRRRIEKLAEDREADKLVDPSDRWDIIARANHELKTAYSDNGLSSQARRARVRERHARRKEAKADGTLRGTAAWFGSLISRWTTGYGVHLLPVVVIMSTLLLGSAVVYSATGMGVEESLYYSVVTFTTSPPSNPDPGWMRLVAGIETILGTTMIVFLGYVLGSREQI